MSCLILCIHSCGKPLSINIPTRQKAKYNIYYPCNYQCNCIWLKVYCKPIIIGGYLIWRFLPSGHVSCYLNWLSLVVFSMKLIKVICIGGYLIWRFLGPSQIHQLKSPPNINRFTVCFIEKVRSYISLQDRLMMLFDFSHCFFQRLSSWHICKAMHTCGQPSLLEFI